MEHSKDLLSKSTHPSFRCFLKQQYLQNKWKQQCFSIEIPTWPLGLAMYNIHKWLRLPPPKVLGCLGKCKLQSIKHIRPHSPATSLVQFHPLPSAALQSLCVAQNLLQLGVTEGKTLHMSPEKLQEFWVLLAGRKWVPWLESMGPTSMGFEHP